jgi:predicted nucleic acid-binding Zn ribbon protein
MAPDRRRAKGRRPDGPSRDGDGPRPLRASLAELSRWLSVPGAFELGLLREQWGCLVGAHVASHCLPLSLGDGVLVVVAENTLWAAELRFRSATLLERVRAVVPEVASVIVKVGPKDRQSW